MLEVNVSALEQLSHDVIGAAIEVHKHLGPGLLEGIYSEALVAELGTRSLRCQREVEVPVAYKGQRLGKTLRLDLIVENSLIVEVKAVEKLEAVHTAQLLTYLRLTDKKLGLLLNFNVEAMRQGIKRVANNL